MNNRPVELTKWEELAMVKEDDEKLRARTFNEKVKKGKREMPEGFADRLKFFRSMRGYTCQQLADLAKTSSAYINKIEKGVKESVSYPIIEKMADALDVDIVDLIGIKLKNKKKLTSIQEMLVTDEYLIKGELPKIETRIKLAEVINLLLGCEWVESSKHKDSVQIFYKINEFLMTVK